jgi:cysteine desulfurase
VQVSHVLEAMGVEPALASSALRISLGWETGESDIERLLTAWNTVVSSLLKKQPNIAA